MPTIKQYKEHNQPTNGSVQLTVARQRAQVILLALQEQASKAA